MNEDYNEKIKKYYNHSTFFYRYLWGNKKNLAMHFGFWDKDTKNLNDALINENRYVAEKLGIKKGDSVLDAGCGIGGTDIWIAENYRANVIGITIVKEHVQKALNYAKERGVSDLIKFESRDFCKTEYSDESFDKIYGMESVCHAINKKDFINEAYRLLKIGGKLIICDGFLIKDFGNLNEKEANYYNDLCIGWALPNLSTHKKFHELLLDTGFKDIKFFEGTNKIMRSSEEMYKSSKLIHPLVGLLAKIGLTPKTNVLAEIACQAQYHIFKNKIALYGIFIAEK